MRPLCMCGQAWPCPESREGLGASQGHERLSLDDRPVMDDRDNERAVAHLNNARTVLDLQLSILRSLPGVSFVPEDSGATITSALVSVWRRVFLARIAFEQWCPDPGAARAMLVDTAMTRAEVEARIACRAWRRYLRQSDWQPIHARVVALLMPLREKLGHAVHVLEAED